MIYFLSLFLGLGQSVVDPGSFPISCNSCQAGLSLLVTFFLRMLATPATIAQPIWNSFPI